MESGYVGADYDAAGNVPKRGNVTSHESRLVAQFAFVRASCRQSRRGFSPDFSKW